MHTPGGSSAKSRALSSEGGTRDTLVEHACSHACTSSAEPTLPLLFQVPTSKVTGSTPAASAPPTADETRRKRSEPAPRSVSIAACRVSSRNCSLTNRWAVFTPFSTAPRAFSKRDFFFSLASSPRMPEPLLKLLVPVYWTEITSPASVHSLRSAACKFVSSAGVFAAAGSSHAVPSARSCAVADCKPSTVCAMLVRLRQSRQLVRTMPRCVLTGAVVLSVPAAASASFTRIAK